MSFATDFTLQVAATNAVKCLWFTFGTRKNFVNVIDSLQGAKAYGAAGARDSHL